ncbi:hypothetical protein [Dissulfurispira sp.]|uniref:hypothetical protein n=1 Tax=Dissulfurispira sp. TaxID=2817609 RepID=UPI002FDA0A04
MKTSLMVNDYVVPLNDFMQDYIANILCAIANSFGMSPNSVTVCVDSEDFHVYTEKRRNRYFKKRFCEAVDRKHG